MKALTPKELGAIAGSDIPDVVIEAVNNLLKKKFRKGSVTLLQKDITTEIKRLNHEYTPDYVYKQGWLDFEPVFERAGWKVTYDKPGYCESYEPSFEFTPKK